MTNPKIKVIFMGTPDFALPALKSLVDDSEFEILGVVTQPDKKIGRKQEITPPPVKVLADRYKLPTLQPDKVRDNQQFQKLLQGLTPDFLVVVAYGQILPRAILDIPKYGAINVHASLLPLYRGASPIESALLHGDKETGITIMKIEEKLDSGAILHVEKLPIESKDNADTLTIKLSFLGGLTLPHVLKEIVDGALPGIPQNERLATSCHKIKKDDGLVELNKLTAPEIQNRIRAFTPWPSCFLIIDGKRFKLLEAEIDMTQNIKPGQTIELEKNTVALGTKKGLLIPLKVQLEGKKPMTIQEFLPGNRGLLTKLLTSPK